MLRSRTHPQTFAERLAAQKARFEKQASQLKPGPERDDLLKKAQQIDTARDINEWLNSPGLQAPRSQAAPVPHYRAYIIGPDGHSKT